MLRYFNKKLIIKVDEKMSKDSILEKLIDLVDNETELFTNKASFREKIDAREAIGTTGIGRGIAVPHARCEQLEDTVFAVALCPRGISDYNTPDGEEVKLIVLVGAPKTRNGEYLKLLSDISRAFRQKNYRENILLARDQNELIEEIAHLGE